MNQNPENKLIREKSPYLLQHAHNPVDWRPWGPEAFEEAQREDKPIFLSIGYSTCHWCHVMAHESFENEAIARLLNEHFVSIKVDREERPDVDRAYMTFVQATTGAGGWPMSVFLTPDLKPFAGGTYFPPEDRYGRAGFPTILMRVAEAWRQNRAQVIEHGDRLVKALRQGAGANHPSEVQGHEVLQMVLIQLKQGFDCQFGGFGTAPKFPHPVTLNLLFRFDSDSSPEASTAREMALLTLKKMAAGGIRDHLGGGFHRYSVDRFWHVPHFEKMLYDQAQLAISYLEAFQITGEAAYAEVAREILSYVQRDLMAPEGGFYSAEDADSPSNDPAHPHPGEGLFYLWRKEEIENALGKQAADIFSRFYGVESEGNAPEGSDPQGEFIGKNILIQRHSLEELAQRLGQPREAIATVLSQAKQTLFEIRQKRPRPHRDDKIITAWNGLMISAYARASSVLGDPAYLRIATKAAEFIQDHLLENGFLLRSYRNGPSTVQGFADDYAFMIQALLDLYEAGFQIRWLKLAVALQEKQDALFADPQNGGFFSVSADNREIFLRIKEDYDGAEPSANSIAALNLLRLAQMLGEEKYRDSAIRTVNAFGEQLQRGPTAMPQMLVALELALAKPRQIIIAAPDIQKATELIQAVHSRFFPNKVILLADGGQGQEWLGAQRAFLKGITPIDGKPTAYVCVDFSCQLPTSDPEQLKEQLEV